jgi:hypothetical protein
VLVPVAVVTAVGAGRGACALVELHHRPFLVAVARRATERALLPARNTDTGASQPRHALSGRCSERRCRRGSEVTTGDTGRAERTGRQRQTRAQYVDDNGTV